MTEKAKEVEMTAEESKAQLRVAEQDILKGLLAAADHSSDECVQPVEIIRGGKTLFQFRVRPLEEAQYQKCRDKNTKFVRNKQLGIRMPEDTNTVRYRSQLIYEATLPEDRKTVWDNKDAWQALTVVSGVDLIDKVLLAGEKDAVLETIDRISGYSATTLEDTAKN